MTPPPPSNMYHYWQQQAWNRLQNARQHDRLAHAYLFTGPAGLGKTDFATCFAMSVLCQHPTEDQIACGQCRDCRMNRAGNHPNYYTIKPLDDKKTIGIEQIRQLNTTLTNSPYSGQRRVIVMPSAHLITQAAANALLKTLEEPGHHILFLLTSEYPHLLPNTLRSRCQILSFPPLSIEQLTDYLHQHTDLKHDHGLLAALCQGAPLQYIFWEKALPSRRALLEKFHAFIEGHVELCQLADYYQTLDPTIVLECLYTYLSDAIGLKMNLPKYTIINRDREKALLFFTQTINLSHLFELLDNIVAIKKHGLAPYTLNRSSCLEDFLVNVYKHVNFCYL